MSVEWLRVFGINDKKLAKLGSSLHLCKKVGGCFTLDPEGSNLIQ